MNAIMKKVCYSLIFCILMFCFGDPAKALSIYNSENFFLSIAPIDSIETFDEFPNPTYFNTAKVVINKVVYETSAIAPESGEPIDPNDLGNPALWTIGINMYPCYISPPNDFGSNGGYPHKITFGKGKFVKAFGFWFVNYCEGNFPLPHWEITIEEVCGQVTLIDVNCEGGIVLPQFYGFISDTGIRKITINDYEGDGGGSNWSYDNVSRSKILKKMHNRWKNH